MTRKKENNFYIYFVIYSTMTVKRQEDNAQRKIPRQCMYIITMIKMPTLASGKG